MTKSDPLVSIVLPTFNRANMLVGSIESCVNQTYKNLEIIIVDDGSTDNTEQVVQKLIEKHSGIKYYKKQNGGLPKALNYGFQFAKGKYFTWTSDDNLYGEKAIEIMVNALDNQDKFKLVYCDYNHIDENGIDLGSVSRKGPEFITKEPTVGACFLYSSECARSLGGYDPKWVLIEDAEFFLRFAEKHPCLHLDGIRPYYYRIHKESLAWSRFESVQRQKAKLFSSRSDSLLESININAKFHYDCSLWNYNSGDVMRSLKHLLCSILLNPFKRASWILALRIILPKRIKSIFTLILEKGH